MDSDRADGQMHLDGQSLAKWPEDLIGGILCVSRPIHKATGCGVGTWFASCLVTDAGLYYGAISAVQNEGGEDWQSCVSAVLKEQNRPCHQRSCRRQSPSLANGQETCLLFRPAMSTSYGAPRLFSAYRQNNSRTGTHAEAPNQNKKSVYPRFPA